MNKTAIRNFAVTARNKLTACLKEETAADDWFFCLTALRFMEVNHLKKKNFYR